MSAGNPMRYVLGGAVAVALGLGAWAYGNNNSSTGGAGVASAAAANAQPPAGGMPQRGQAPPGFGTPASGASATKAKAAALARYQGSVEQVMKLDDGSYVVHVITSGGEYHVTVSKAFKVTGADQGRPGRRRPRRGHDVLTNLQ